MEFLKFATNLQNWKKNRKIATIVYGCRVNTLKVCLDEFEKIKIRQIAMIVYICRVHTLKVCLHEFEIKKNL